MLLALRELVSQQSGNSRSPACRFRSQTTGPRCSPHTFPKARHFYLLTQDFSRAKRKGRSNRVTPGRTKENGQTLQPCPVLGQAREATHTPKALVHLKRTHRPRLCSMGSPYIGPVTVSLSLPSFCLRSWSRPLAACRSASFRFILPASFYSARPFSEPLSPISAYCPAWPVIVTALHFCLWPAAPG